MLGELARRHACQEDAADAQMNFAPLLFWDQGIGRLLDPVMQELVGVIRSNDEPSEDGFPECRVQRLLGLPVNLD